MIPHPSSRLRWVSRGLALLAFTVATSVVLVPMLPAEEPSEASQPARKDTNPRARPDEVSFSTSIEPSEAQAGDTVTYQVTATVDQPWHIFSLTHLGGEKTAFDFFDTAGLRIAGDWEADKEPIRKKDESLFPNLPFAEYYEDEVTWSVPLRIPGGTEPGEKTLRNQIAFQICDPTTCKFPTRWTLPEATLTVLPGGLSAEEDDEEPVSAAPGAPVGGPGATETATTTPGAVGGVDAASTRVMTDVERSLERGLIPFLLLSATGGLIALIMPCVWPMVPITVNFFVKQGQARKDQSTLGLAITYCVAIIAIYTLVGLLFSALFGAASLQRLANAAWLNLLVAALFFAFGLSLLGVFEFRLPSFLLNASAQGEARGGLIGVIFMALTLTITSFTCTFPVVGALLVMAAGGNYFYPIIGLATFATVLAIPFFLLALSPSLLNKMPRGGDWMNAVKVVGGLVEIGAAFKFLNMAEISMGAVPEDAWINAPALLTIWIVLSLICGLYLLGMFRTDHDHADVKVGAGRILTGSLFLCLALYLTPALFGRPPMGPFYGMIVGILPPDISKLHYGGTMLAEASGANGGVQKATSTDPEEALRQEKTFHGVQWGMSYDAALEQAKEENRPVLIDFTGVNCANCRRMENEVLPRSDVVPLLQEFVTVQLYTDFVPIGSLTPAQREDLAIANQDMIIELTGEATNPFYVVVTPDGKVLSTIGGYRPPSVFINFLETALAEFRNGQEDDAEAQISMSP